MMKTHEEVLTECQNLRAFINEHHVLRPQDYEDTKLAQAIREVVDEALMMEFALIWVHANSCDWTPMSIATKAVEKKRKLFA